MTVNNKRFLALLERYSLSRRNAGVPYPIAITVAYSTLPSSESICKRIVELQDHFPLLYATVQDPFTNKPYFEEGKPWLPEDILRSVDVENGSQDEILLSECHRYQKMGLDRPLWQIGLHSSKDGLSYLSLTVDHMIIDGRGLTLLLSALLATDIADLPYEKLVHIPKAEDTYDIRPSVLFVLSVVLSDMVLPKLPAFIQSFFSQASWPTESLRPPLECPWEFSSVLIPATTIDQLKFLGKQNGVPTLHPILGTAYLVALYQVLGSPSTASLSLGSPLSERKSELGHPYCTASYMSTYESLITISPSSDIWTLAGALHTGLHSPEGRKQARQAIGMLTYIPDEPTIPTGWEKHLLEKAGSKRPLSQAVEFSNLGYLDLPEGAEGLAWIQPASPFGFAATLSAVGTTAGVSVGISWRDGCVLERKQVIKLQKNFEGVLQNLVNEKNIVDDTKCG